MIGWLLHRLGVQDERPLPRDVCAPTASEVRYEQARHDTEAVLRRADRHALTWERLFQVRGGHDAASGNQPDAR